MKIKNATESRGILAFEKDVLMTSFQEKFVILILVSLFLYLLQNDRSSTLRTDINLFGYYSHFIMIAFKLVIQSCIIQNMYAILSHFIILHKMFIQIITIFRSENLLRKAFECCISCFFLSFCCICTLQQTSRTQNCKTKNYWITRSHF